MQQVTEPEAAPEQTDATPVGWMSRQKATAMGHLTMLTRRRRTAVQVETATDNGTDPAKRSPQVNHLDQSPIDKQKNDEHDLTAAEDPGRSPQPVTPNTFTKRIQDIFSTLPSFASGTASVSSPPTSPAPQSNPISPALSFLTLPTLENSPFEHGWQSLCSAMDRLRLPHGKTAGTSESSRDDVLDCIDDNNSVMMYGPLEPDATSEVEIACSEIVSVNGDGEEIRTPQPHYVPLPSESLDEALAGRGPRSPPPRCIPLPLESMDEALVRRGLRSPSPRFSPLSFDAIDEALVRRGLRSPSPRFTPLPLGSIDQVLMGGGTEASSLQWKESESETGPAPTSAAQEPPEPTAEQPPTKEYRVWLPSPTKISLQTMWWGFRIYLPPPVLDVLNNKQLEAAKRAALITTALQWLMDHLPISLLPPQMHPGVAILRYLVPYVGYMGGFIAWTWSAIRSFDKGYGVVLTATWLLPFLLIPGTWEADEAPNVGLDPPRPSVSS